MPPRASWRSSNAISRTESDRVCLLPIAYEFPPIPLPQSLRWTRLARELARRGHAVHVLAPDVPGDGPAGCPPCRQACASTAALPAR